MHRPYQHYRSAFFQESRLLRFADVHDSDSESTNIPEFERQMLDKYRDNILKNNSNFTEDFVQHIRPVLSDPNLMAQDAYKNYITALSLGRFPSNPLRFLQALSQPKKSKERRHAAKICAKLASSTASPLSASEERKQLHKLDELKTEDLTAQTKEKATQASSQSLTTPDITGAIKGTVEKNLPTHFIWTPENAPQEMIDEVRNLYLQFKDTVTKINSLKDKLASFSSDKLHSEEAKRTLAEILKLEVQLKKLDRQINNPEFNAMRLRVVKRYRSIKDLSAAIGVDILDQPEIMVWILDEKATKSSLGGTEIEAPIPAHRNERKITITEVYFEDSSEQDAAGEGRVKYIDEEGEPQDSSFVYLQTRLRALEAHEKTPDSLDEEEDLQKLFKSKLGYAVNTQDKFQLRLPIDLDENGDIIAETYNFQIEEIYQQSGEWLIKLNKPMILTAKTELPRSFPAKLYFDRKQQIFTVGQFITFIRRNSIKKNLKNHQEYQQIINNLQANRATQVDQFANMVNLDPEYRELYKFLERVPTTSSTFKPEDHQALDRVIGAHNSENTDIPWRVNNTTTGDPAATPEQPAEPEEEEQELPGPTPESDDEEETEAEMERYYDITLPYDDVYKTGGITFEERSFLRAWWLNTRFFSISNIWEFGKSIIEYIQRKWARNEKEKYASIAQDLPYISPEMKRILQAAEADEVGQFQQGLENEGVTDIRERLHTTRNRDELKACFNVLTSLGQLRWDDIEMWKQLNRWVDTSVQKPMPIPSNDDPYTRVNEKGDTGFDFLEPVIDHIWGDGSYNSWFSQNKSTYDSKVKGFYEKGKELELVEGGHARELQNLLKRHKAGEYVDPHLYESLISHAISQGKSDILTKVYYMIQGVTAENPDGKTLMSFDRIAHLDGELLGNFPLLDFMVARIERADGKIHRLTKDDYNLWRREFDAVSDESKPNQAVFDFLWNYVLPHKATQRRIKKVLRDPQIDHEDMPFFFPSATEQQVTDLGMAAAGSRRFFSTEAFKNVYPGFSQYIRSLQESGRVDQLQESIISYVRFDSIMTKRWKPKESNLARLDPGDYDKPAIMSGGVKLRELQSNMNGSIRDIISQYAHFNPKLAEISKFLFADPANYTDPKDKARIQESLEQFASAFRQAVKMDGGKILSDNIAKGDLIGMPFNPDLIKGRLKKTS